MKPIIVYITFPIAQNADMVGAVLVKTKLASCVISIPTVHAQYIWEGKYNHDEQILMIVKTFDTKFAALEKIVKKLHSDKTPCIISVPVSKASKDFLLWSKKQCL